MKTIHLIRHAKSSWQHTHLSDQNRPLSKRGINDCGIMAKALLAAGVQFSQVYCSRAQRAQLTIQGLAENWRGKPIEWQTSDALYTFSSTQLWQIVSALGDELDQVFLVGHNPAFTDFINEASGVELDNLPTCAYARLVFPVNIWHDIRQQQAELADLMRPKMFK